MTLQPPALQAQTYKVLYAFHDGVDGRNPWASLTMDQAGNLYGTTVGGGSFEGDCGRYDGCGSVFKLTPTISGWIFTSLYAFQGGRDGVNPKDAVVFGPDGNLYGTTAAGGILVTNPARPFSFGTVYKLTPPANCVGASCAWTETILYRFTGGADGFSPGCCGNLIFDRAGNLYDTTEYGGNIGGPCGNYGCGVVFKLTASRDGWTESVLHAFSLDQDGCDPASGVIFDQAGNLYGETFCCGDGYGLVYELSPTGDGWAETVLYTFQFYGHPLGGVVFDPEGNLYGVTPGGAFQLIPSGGGWTYDGIHGFGNGGPGNSAHLVRDADGNLYGTTNEDGACNNGNVFKLTPSPFGWMYTDLHDFCGPDGAGPLASVLLDAHGNIYGTTEFGGDLSACPVVGCGVVWEITSN